VSGYNLTKQNYNATDQTKSVLDHEQMRALMRRLRLSTRIKDQNSLTLETFNDIKGADAFLALFRLDN
jgi:hypothetical protein